MINLDISDVQDLALENFLLRKDNAKLLVANQNLIEQLSKYQIADNNQGVGSADGPTQSV